MANVRKLPKLGGKRKVGEEDEEDKENFSAMCSPFKQLKLSPIHKSDSSSHVLLSNCAGEQPISFIGISLFFVLYVPSTARSFTDGTPIYCPLQRT